MFGRQPPYKKVLLTSNNSLASHVVHNLVVAIVSLLAMVVLAPPRHRLRGRCHYWEHQTVGKGLGEVERGREGVGILGVATDIQGGEGRRGG